MRRTPLQRRTRLVNRTRLRPKRQTRVPRGSTPEERKALREMDAAKEAAEHAATYGCEYGQRYLREVFKSQGCDLCGRWHPPAELHHTVSRRRGGKAEHQVILGKTCHTKGHGINGGWETLQAKHGKDLAAIAAAHAAEGHRRGYLPVECCALCTEAGHHKKAWHSSRYMLDQIEDGEPVRRICVWCAPEGPP